MLARIEKSDFYILKKINFRERKAFFFSKNQKNCDFFLFEKRVFSWSKINISTIHLHTVKNSKKPQKE